MMSPRCSPQQANGPDHHVLPDVDVLGGVGHHDGLAGRAAGCVQPNDFRHLAGEQTERVSVPQVGLLHERQLLDVLQRLDRRGSEAAIFHPLAKQPHPVVGPRDHHLQPSQLKIPQLRNWQIIRRAGRVEAAGRIIPLLVHWLNLPCHSPETNRELSLEHRLADFSPRESLSRIAGQVRTPAG